MCVCVTMKRKCQTNGKHNKRYWRYFKYQQAQRKEKYNNKKRPILSVDHCHPYGRKKEKQLTKPTQSFCSLPVCLFVSLCVSVCLSATYTPSSLHHKAESSLFLSTGKHPKLVQLPWASCILLCSAYAEQRPPKPTAPQKNFFDFSLPFRQCSQNALRSMH